MALKGKIYAYKNTQRVENMEIGILYYIDLFDLILTQKALFVDRIAPIITKEEYDECDEPEMNIPIKRLGYGLTSDDFEIDFSGITEDSAAITIQPEIAYIELMDEKELYVIFEKPEIHFIEDISKNMEPEKYIEHLNQKMQEAANNQDFHEAERLKRLIEKESKKLN